MKKFEFLIIAIVALLSLAGLNSYAQLGNPHVYQVILDDEYANYVVPGTTIILKDQNGRVQDIGETGYNGTYDSLFDTNNLMAAHYNYLVGTEGERIDGNWTIIRLTQPEQIEPQPPRRPVELLAPEE